MSNEQLGVGGLGFRVGEDNYVADEQLITPNYKLSTIN